MARKITMCRVNGVGTKGKMPPRFVIERNVLDMLEENEKYMNLDFCTAEELIECATVEELLNIYTEEMTTEDFEELYNRIFG